LVRNDPKAHKEQELIESVKDSLEADFDLAISGLNPAQQEDAEEAFFELREDDWWDDLGEAIEARKKSQGQEECLTAVSDSG
jgi:alanine-alpha-ketoisovalerate/valine-pyruvate aminotransferase